MNKTLLTLTVIELVIHKILLATKIFIFDEEL